MLVIPGQRGKDLCDRHQVSRRELLRVGGSAMLGLNLAGLLKSESRASESYAGGPGFGRAKSVIMVYLQGGPSHLDMWMTTSKARPVYGAGRTLRRAC